MSGNEGLDDWMDLNYTDVGIILYLILLTCVCLVLVACIKKKLDEMDKTFV